jgi:hypothetical protein
MSLVKQFKSRDPIERHRHQGPAPDARERRMTLRRRRQFAGFRLRAPRDRAGDWLHRCTHRPGGSTTRSPPGTASRPRGSAHPPGPRPFTTPTSGPRCKNNALLLILGALRAGLPLLHCGPVAPARRGLADLSLHLLHAHRDLLGRARSGCRTLLRLPGHAQLDHPLLRLLAHQHQHAGLRVHRPQRARHHLRLHHDRHQHNAVPHRTRHPRSRALEEAARIDGAGRWRIFRSITLPHLSAFHPTRLRDDSDRALQRAVQPHLRHDRRRTGLRHHDHGIPHLPDRLQPVRLRHRRALRHHPVRAHRDRGHRATTTHRIRTNDHPSRRRRQRETNLSTR